MQNQKKFKIPQIIIDQCFKFAEQVVQTTKSYIQKRNQFDQRKLILDHAYGKIGQFAVWKWLKSQGIQCDQPDRKITRAKKFSADLHNNQMNFHVKTCSKSSLQKYGLSWMFQKNDPVIKTPNDNDFFVGVILENESDAIYCTIATCKKFINLNHAIGQPVNKNLITKKAIYYSKIKGM